MSVPRVVVMGVSGCGKSTVGRALADLLGVHYVEGDELHSAANVQRMAAGVALTDADRHGWLLNVGRQLAGATAQQRGVVVACSALKRSYRDLLRAAALDVKFVFLNGEPQTIGQRLAARQGHYMPLTLLQSQLDTLQPPGPDEDALTLDIQQAPQALADAAARWLTRLPA